MCDAALVACGAVGVGCPWAGRRGEAREHAAACAFTYLRPLLEEHAARLAALERDNAALRKKVDVLVPSWRAEERERSESDSAALDDSTLQLLTEQERVRSELERVFAAIAELDVKQAMLTMHMSDNMRTREEVAMIGAAVNNLRSQLHGLQLLTLRRQTGSAPSPGGGGGGSPSSSSAPARAAAAVSNIVQAARQLSGDLSPCPLAQAPHL